MFNFYFFFCIFIRFILCNPGIIVNEILNFKTFWQMTFNLNKKKYRKLFLFLLINNLYIYMAAAITGLQY